ncbi:MAG: hypothetical protein ACK5LS_09565 [Propioniciclava sp.]
MVPPAWGIPVVLVVGIAVVWFGWWWDRRRNRRAEQALREPPGSIPDHDGPSPGYTTESDLADQRPAEASVGSGADRPTGADLPGGTIDPAFLTADDTFGILEHPLVLVVDAHLDDDQLLLDPLSRAQREDRGLVLVAHTYTEAVRGMLRANAVTRRVAVLPIAVAETVALRRAVALTGGRLVPALDLRSGYLPDQVWGRCARWACDLTTSWVQVDDLPGADPQPDIQRS